ncbi:MAG: response regulator transcription factor [Gammaproteobacteria bacterium]|jgi:two-component system response regulator CpxR
MDNKLLLVDDDKELCEMLKDYLAQEGFTADTVYDGDSAVEQALNSTYCLIVLDIMLPGRSGFEVLKSVREQSTVPVLVLTARGEDMDSVIGLELGADDYVAKPCSPRVLLAHIRAVLRRSTSNYVSNNTNAQLTIGDLELYPQSRTVYRNQAPVNLTSTEFTILETLMRNAGSIVNKNELSEIALGRKLAHYDRSLDVHISNMRKKLGFVSDQHDRIKTVRNVGYLFSK